MTEAQEKRRDELSEKSLKDYVRKHLLPGPGSTYELGYSAGFNQRDADAQVLVDEALEFVGQVQVICATFDSLKGNKPRVWNCVENFKEALAKWKGEK